MRTSASVLACLAMLPGICHAQQSTVAQNVSIERSAAVAIDAVRSAEQRQGSLLPKGRRRHYGDDAAARRRTGVILMAAGFATVGTAILVLKDDDTHADAGTVLAVVGGGMITWGFLIFEEAKDILPTRLHDANGRRFGVRYRWTW